MSDTSSVNVDGLNRLIGAMNRAHNALNGNLDELRGRMRSEGVSLRAFIGLDRIADWIDDQVPGLQRRRNMAEALTGDRPSTTMVGFTEPLPFASPEEAERHGRELARQFLDHETVDAEILAELFEEFPDYVNDPDVMAGFYLELGPEQTEVLPSYIVATGADQGEYYLRMLSEGLGTALSTNNNHSTTSDYYSELAEFRRHFQTPTETPALAWNRMALLQHGDFPPRWLANVVRANVLDHFEGDEWDHTDYRGHLNRTLGLSGDTLALAFSALGNNPSAARIALSERAGIDLEEYAERVYGLGGVIGTGDEILDGFGLALAAGSGALDDPPDKGSAAATFAFGSILALGRFEDTPRPMREHLVSIATAYAEELLAGAFTLDGLARESSMTMPDNFDLPVGLEPLFYLSPEAVYRFLHGFGHGDLKWFDDVAEGEENMQDIAKPFDDAVQELYESLAQGALDADLEATANGDRDPRNFEKVMNVFGSLAGLQYQAQRSVRGELDRLDEEFRGTVQQVISEGLTLSPTPPGLSSLSWKLMKIGINRHVKSWANDAGGRVDELDMEVYQARLLYDYMVAETMLQAGYPYTEAIPPNLLNDDGDGLRDPAEVVGDPDLWTEFYEWTDSNKADFEDHPNRPPFDEKFDNSRQYLDASDGNQSERIAGETDWESSVR
ncbi:hypothetical protein [Phytoactinopolyspora limicola]|uniref:hypothetical protein n=1 Tax=Phytoactinopolyspora limicola TaxID=2715536 RepID=UPI001409D81C|nr:hypothetical protein [Phytoactinopolyspora limicola]